MPTGIKFTISVLVVLVGAVAYVLETQSGRDTLGWVAAGLAALMVLAMWIFPETGGKDDRS